MLNFVIVIHIVAPHSWNVRKQFPRLSNCSTSTHFEPMRTGVSKTYFVFWNCQYFFVERVGFVKTKVNFRNAEDIIGSLKPSNIFCIPESFNMNISHQYTILHNNLCEFTALLDHRWIGTERAVLNVRFNYFDIQKYIRLRFGVINSINKL